MKIRTLVSCLLFLFALPMLAQDHTAFNKPWPAFKIMGNLYYVGTDDLGSFLIATPQGNILINSDFDDTVPEIRDSVEKLGFKFTILKFCSAATPMGTIWMATRVSRK